MRYVRLFTRDGLSAFEDHELELETLGHESFVNLLAPSGLIINETLSGYQYDWHNAPKRQWVITIGGEIEVTLRDGSSRTFKTGDLLLAEDLTGSGHKTKVVSPEPWKCLYIPF